MPSYNSVQLMGNLTRDPEVRYTPKGTAIAEIGMAISRKYKDGNDQMQEEVTFVDVTYFGAVAEVVGKYLTKGSPVFVAGRLQLDQWEDKQSGQKRSKLKVVGEVMQMLGGKREGDSGGQSQARPASGQRQQSPQGRQSAPQTADDVFGGGDLVEDDIPFGCPHYLMVGGV